MGGKNKDIRCEIRALTTGKPCFYFGKQLEGAICVDKSGFYDLRRLICKVNSLIHNMEMRRKIIREDIRGKAESTSVSVNPT